MEINFKLEYWKNQLLDLGKKNRLINCPLPKTGKRISRTALLICSPAYDNLWKTFTDAEGENTLKFSIPDVTSNDSVDEIDEQQSLFKCDIFPNGVQTNQNCVETCKTLRRLMKRSKEFLSEKGLNALYLAFGFLNWKEKGIDGQELRSPLLLIPVTLSQESLIDPIVLARLDDEITMNHALEQKLQIDFGIELPQFEEGDDWKKYLEQVQKACASLKWEVEADVAQLSLFSFLKINMYRDLEKNVDKIREHRVVRALNGESFKNDVDCSDIKSFDHDTVEPQKVFSILDADSSQQDAILLAKRGASFVLQGPPGTGKSQTITNIIAELMAEGKKVLFVSEKVAALEVVYKRLKKNGLGDFCLVLYSHHAKRREILDQLEVSLKLSRKKVRLQQDAFDQLEQLTETRSALNQYVQELHTVVEPLGKTIYQVQGILAKYNNYKNIDYIQSNADKFTSALLLKSKLALEELAHIVDKSGYQQHNPWNGCVLTSISYEFRQRFLVDAEKLTNSLSQGITLYHDIMVLLGSAKLIPSYNAIPDIVSFLNLARQSPNIPVEWINVDLAEQIVQLDECTRLLTECSKLTELYDQTICYENKLQVAIQAAADVIYNAEQKKYTETNTAYCLAYNDFISICSSNESKSILSNCKNLGEQLVSCQQLNDQYETLQTEKCSLKDAVSNATQSLKSQQQLLLQDQNALDVARSQISDDYDTGILSIDAEGLLYRYKNTYHSVLRVFNRKYRDDKNNLIKYCKKASNISYSMALLLLEKVNDTQLAQENLAKQTKIVEAAQISENDKKAALDKNLTAIKDIRNSLAKGKEKFEAIKKKISSEIADYIQALNRDRSTADKLFENTCESVNTTLHIETNNNYDFKALRGKLTWAVHFLSEADKYACSSSFAVGICKCDSNTLQVISQKSAEINDWANGIKTLLKKFSCLFAEQMQTHFYEMPLSDLKQAVQACKDNFVSLEYSIDYRNAEEKLKKLGIDSFLNKAKELNLPAAEIIPVFAKCFCRSWLDAVLPKFPSVNSFRRLRQDEYIQKFRHLDKQYLEISKAALIAKLVSRLPDFDSFSANSGEIALLRREMAKQRRLMPIRKLIAAVPNLLPALKPCIMMSPLSVSTYLGGSNYEFDTVIFDEASQVPTEDAICSIFRAKQAIIAGDSKQLPPTDFFNSSMLSSDDSDQDEENSDAGAYESLLDEASMLPTQTLLWHYRSKSEDLIAFSNAKIYQGSLITFPSPVEKAKGMGVEYVHVAGGIYERRGKGNQKEAEKIAELVFEHFREFPNRSLGIIAFGEIQQAAIEEAIIRKRRENPQYESFFKEDKEENVFIKNLETVQGDERDTIIFSIGYAPDASGKFIMNFGPLSRKGGERRLNVAITRARYNLKLVGSILPTDIDVDRTSGQGPKLLRLYIDYAINGAKVILGETTINHDLWFDSSFEEAIYNFITAHGYEAATQVGCSGYRIDMAVRHPKFNGRFAIGIECDGAAYHSARTARERDRLRQTVLEDMGWHIYRVWSTDWIKDQHTEGEHLLQAIQEAIDNYCEPRSETSSDPLKVTDYLRISHKSIQESCNKKYKDIESPYAGYSANEIPVSDFEKTMLRVLKTSYGLDKEALFKETAQYGYIWKRQGSAIKKKFESAYKGLLKQNKICEKEGAIILTDLSKTNSEVNCKMKLNT
ncbi:MAG: DUF4011 domain-containing protein [Oscillospiraceae bacterium]|nr:DUF4011 domain-containing protein [Oscillospiraceae bacterium]